MSDQTDSWIYSRLDFILDISSASFSSAKRMVGQDILCKFLVNNVIAYHLWTITSPLIAQGGDLASGNIVLLISV